MTKKQSIHVGMLNSFNLITGAATIDDIIKAGLGLFAHVPDEEIDVRDIKFIIQYFESIEMFEYCATLLDYMNENYNEDGSLKGEDCDCEFPEIKEYVTKMTCFKCKKRLKK